jgi:hypothetical protein
LKVFNVLLRDLNIGLEFKDVDEVLTFVSEFFFEVINLFWCTWVFELINDVEEHGIFVRLLHDFSNFVVEIS